MSDTEFNKPRLAIGSSGWTHQQWNKDYYPEDMPAEWQLDFYSNHFPCVLMQSDEWENATEQQIMQWGEDVKSSFDFFISVDHQPDDKTIAQLEIIKKQLGGKLKGLVLSFAVQSLDKTGLAKLAAVTSLYIDTDEKTVATDFISHCWRAQRQVTNATIGFIDADSAKNIREMRVQIEKFLQQSTDAQLYLFFDGVSPNTSRMQEAQVIFQLIS